MRERQRIFADINSYANQAKNDNIEDTVFKVVQRFLGKRLGLYDREDLLKLAGLVVAAIDSYDRRYLEQ